MEAKTMVPSGFRVPTAILLLSGRRRRLFMYLGAFAGMLAFSYLLDLRKDPIYNWIQKERGVTFSSKLKPLIYPTAVSGSSEEETTATEDSSTPESPVRIETEPELSEQELKDAVDQFINHVEEEHWNNETEAVTNVPSTETAPSIKTNETSLGKAYTATRTGSLNMTIEEQFDEARKALDKAAASSSLKNHMNPDELRNLRALELQAIRGDCEKSADSGAGNGLFKSDAEVAGDEVEKTDALWGAWCVFSGRYQSDAMRQYVSASYAFRERAAAQAEVGDTPLPPFDENEATIDDVITPESLQTLQDKAKFIKPHLQEGDARLLSAIALQAMYGDCIPYAKVVQEEGKEYRKLEEPIFEKVAKRKEGNLWGAWCVFAKTARAKAADILIERVKSFWNQLELHTNESKMDSKVTAVQSNTR